LEKYTTNIHIIPRKIYVIRIEKSPFSRKIKARLTLLQQAAENSGEGKTKQRTKDQETKTKKDQKINKTLKPYEQQCQSHTCSGTREAKTIKAIAYSLCSIRPESFHAINFLK
jgi:hypothetical protein